MKQDNRKTILIAIITLALLLANILIYLNKIAKPQRANKEIQKQYAELTGQEVENNVKTKTQEEIVKEELESVKSKTESERIRYYLGKYLNYIELEDYENAYNLLYPDFKQNYFQTQSDYEKYVKDLYPELIGLQCNDMQRQGEYYILTTTIFDPMGDFEDIVQKFVIKENDYLNFIISFQVI